MMGDDHRTADGCEEARDLLPEVALGTASGDDRAAVLRHVGGCGDCRRHLISFTDLADGLLSLAPRREPPAGFETRVLDRLHRTTRRPPRRGRRVLAVAASILVAASVGAAGVHLINADERDLAGRYRAALAEAHGQYFVAVPLIDGSGRRVGHVFGYQGDPSWVFVAVAEPARGRIDVIAVMREGGPAPLGAIDPGSLGAGFTLPADVHDLASIEVIAEDATWRATFPAPTS